MTGIEGIDWTVGSVRSDIAGDPAAWLLAVGFIGGVPVATAEAFRCYVENWMMGPDSVIDGDRGIRPLPVLSRSRSRPARQR